MFDDGFSCLTRGAVENFIGLKNILVTLCCTLMLSGCGGASSDVSDTDGDGLSDALEKSINTNAFAVDSDNDGLSDFSEVNTYATDPLETDSDSDGLTDYQEVMLFSTNPLIADTDDDGLDDGAEVNRDPRTDPLERDSDGDDLTDGVEVLEYGTNPLSVDTDSDTLRDAIEINNLGTNPLSSDTDGDTYPDGDETRSGTDPVNYFSNIVENAKLRFALPIDLSVSDGHAYAPNVAVDADGNPHVGYHDNVNGGMEIFYVHSSDGGETFTAPLNVSNSPGIAEFAKIAVAPDGTIYITYKDNVDGTANVFLAKKLPDSDEFTPPLNLTRGGVITAAPDVSVDSTGRVVVVWYTTGAVEVVASSDGGYVVDEEGTYVLDENGHMQSSFVQLVSLEGDDSPATTAITIDDDNDIHVAFGKSAVDGMQVFYTRSEEGVFANPPVQISFAEGGTAGSKVAAKGDYVYVSWTDYPLDNEEEINVARSVNGGQTFYSGVNVSNNESVSVFSDVEIMSDGTLVVIWQDTFDGNYETVISRSFDHGVTFEAPDNFNPSEEGSLVSSVAINQNDQIFIVVDDNRFGPFEAVFNRGEVGLPAVAEVSLTENVLTLGTVPVEQTIFTAYSTVPLFWTVQLYKKDETEKVLGRVDRLVKTYVSTPSDFAVEFTAEWDGDVGEALIDGDIDGVYYFIATGLTADGIQAAERKIELTLIQSAADSALEFTEFSSSQKAFAPDGDGRQEVIWFSGNFNRSVDWSLIISDFLGNEIYQVEGAGRSLFVEWDGVNDSGVLMGEGDYTAKVMAVDTEGVDVEDELSFGIDLTAPELQDLTFTPQTFDPNVETMDIDFHITEGAVVTVYIYQGESQLVSELHRLSYPEATDITLTWDGTTGDVGGNIVDPGTYTVRIWCRDFAANRVIEYPVVAEICVGACSE